MPLGRLGEIPVGESFSLPAYSVFRVIEDDAVFGELGADGVRAGEVPGLAGQVSAEPAKAPPKSGSGPRK